MLSLPGGQSSRFYSVGRPKKLTSWLSSKSRFPIRSKNWNAEEIDAFVHEMEKWWDQVQPKWQKTAKELQGNRYSGDLSAFRKGGRSGISTFMFGLQWWQILQPESDAWTEIVRDVGMCLSGKSARTRELADEESTVSVPRKKAKT